MDRVKLWGRPGAKGSRFPRKTIVGLLSTAALVLGLAGPAFATSLYSPGGLQYYTAAASQNGWTGTVTVYGGLNDYRGCSSLWEQGHNNVWGYGSWQFVTSNCSSAPRITTQPFYFNVSDFWSDSVALKICDQYGCRSTHVWH